MSRAARVIAAIPAVVDIAGALLRLATTHEDRLSGLEASLAAEAAKRRLDAALAHARGKGG